MTLVNWFLFGSKGDYHFASCSNWGFLLCVRILRCWYSLPVVSSKNIIIFEIESDVFFCRNSRTIQSHLSPSVLPGSSAAWCSVPWARGEFIQREDPACWTNLTVDNTWSFIPFYRSPLPLLQWRKSLYKFASISPEWDLCVVVLLYTPLSRVVTSVAATRSRHRQQSSTQYTTIVLQCWELAVNSSTVL